MEPRIVYADHAATTPIDARVKEAMEPFIKRFFGNPSSFHSEGKIAKDAIEESRIKVANVLGARTDEIIFTSGGTESDNLAILGFARANQKFGKHLITSKTEHPAVLETMKHLEAKEGFEVTYLNVDMNGLVEVADVLSAIRQDTILISIMFANNEIGTIAPIKEIGAGIQKMRAKEKRAFPIFHTDACQAVGALEVDVSKLHVDMMTVNASKIYGPKGVGALYVKRGLKIQPLQFGGSQEKAIRPGTENVIGIVGFASAIEIAQEERETYCAHVLPLRQKLESGILSTILKTRLNGHPEDRLPNIVNISYLDIEGEALLLYLDAKGVYAATGSACTSQTLDPSHVILALGFPFEVAHGSIRFSLGRQTTNEDIDYILEVLPELVENLRKISPVHVDEKYFSCPAEKL